jgi:hypothetical protein
MESVTNQPKPKHPKPKQPKPNRTEPNQPEPNQPKPNQINPTQARFGLGWFGLGWFGLGWLGLARFGLARFGLARFGLAWFGLAWFGPAWFGLAWFGLVWFGLVWFGLAWPGLVWPGLVRLGLALLLCVVVVGCWGVLPSAPTAAISGLSGCTDLQGRAARLETARIRADFAHLPAFVRRRPALVPLLFAAFRRVGVDLSERRKQERDKCRTGVVLRSCCLPREFFQKLRDPSHVYDFWERTSTQTASLKLGLRSFFGVFGLRGKLTQTV